MNTKSMGRHVMSFKILLWRLFHQSSERDRGVVAVFGFVSEIAVFEKSGFMCESESCQKIDLLQDQDIPYAKN